MLLGGSSRPPRRTHYSRRIRLTQTHTFFNLWWDEGINANRRVCVCVCVCCREIFFFWRIYEEQGKCVQSYLGGIIIFVTQWVSRQTAEKLAAVVRWRHLSTMQSGQTPAAASVEEDRNCKLLTAQRTKRLLIYDFIKRNQPSLNSSVTLKVDISGLLFLPFLFSPQILFQNNQICWFSE